jgi:SAM-dependent methyltransferase
MAIDSTSNTRPAIFESIKRGLSPLLSTKDCSKLTLLDFGCGPRGYVLDWKNVFGDCIGTDIRDFSSEYKGTDIKFATSDGIRVNLPDQSVDIVVSHSVLEHVGNLPAVLSDLNRVTRIGGYFYFTVAPLYYSPTGLHRKKELLNWEHLDPDHRAYLATTPFYENDSVGTSESGALLNKLTTSEFLSAIGAQPWNILSFQKQIVPDREIPSFVDIEKFGVLNLLTKGFVFLGQKARHFQ